MECFFAGRFGSIFHIILNTINTQQNNPFSFIFFLQFLYFYIKPARIDQSVKHWTLSPQVVGSNPGAGRLDKNEEHFSVHKWIAKRKGKNVMSLIG